MPSPSKRLAAVLAVSAMARPFGLDRRGVRGCGGAVGVNLSVIMGHQLEARDLRTLGIRLGSSTVMRGAAERLWTVMRPRWRKLGPLEAFAAVVANEQLDEGQVLEAWDVNDTPSFEWARLSLYVGRHALEATHLEKLAGFVLDLDDLQGPLLACGRALAVALGSPAVMFGPDSASSFELVSDGVCEGRTLNDLLHLAQVHCGPAAHDIRSMAEENGEIRLEQGCYVTERV